MREGCKWDVEGARECGVRCAGVCGCVRVCVGGRVWVGGRVMAVWHAYEGPNPNPKQAGARRRAAS